MRVINEYRRSSTSNVQTLVGTGAEKCRLSEAECPHAEDAIIVFIFDWIVGRDTGTS